MKNNIISLGILSVAMSSASHAVTLAEYKFTGDTAAEQVVATTVDSNVTAGDWEFAPVGSAWSTDPGLSANDSANEVGDPANSGSIFARSSYGTTTSVDPTSTDTFMAFSITVGTLGAGETLNITGFDYSIFATGNNAFDYEVALYSDLTGFDTGDMISDSNLRSDLAVDNASDDLSDELALQGLTSGQVVNFRIYFADDVNNTNQISRLDNIAIIGDVVSVPEPSSAALLALGGLALILRRRK